MPSRTAPPTRKNSKVSTTKEVCMKLVQDLWAHLKEWSDWSMKDWIKAAIVAIIVIIVIGAI